MIRFTCDNCDQNIRAPINLANKSAYCPKCQHILRVPTPLKAKPENKTRKETPKRDIPWPKEIIDGHGQTKPGNNEIQCPVCEYISKAGTSQCHDCGYNYEMKLPGLEVELKPLTHLFFKDIIRLFSQTKDSSDLIILAHMLLINVLTCISVLIGYIGIPTTIIGYGYLLLYSFSTLTETADGKDNLPWPVGIENPYDEIIMPLIHFIISFAYAALPGMLILLVYNMLYYCDIIAETNTHYQTLIYISTGIGLLLWPMIILSIVLGNTLLISPARIIMSIKRTFLPYLLCCGCLYIASLILLFSCHLDISYDYLDIRIAWILFHATAFYIYLYAMKILGLLYRYYHPLLDY